MADELNWQALPVHHTNPYKNQIWSVSLKHGALTKLGLFFPVVCFLHVFDQSLVEQLYRDKDLFSKSDTKVSRSAIILKIVILW